MSRLDLAVAVSTITDPSGCPCFNCSPPSPDELRTLVASAARRLDVAAPSWRSRLDRAALDMMSCINCVLGQVFGDYWTGLRALYGLEAAFGTLTVPRDAQTFGVYAPLRAAWLAELDRTPTAASDPDGDDDDDDDDEGGEEADRDLATAGTRVTAAVARRSLDALLARPYVVAPAPPGPGRSALTELLVGAST